MRPGMPGPKGPRQNRNDLRNPKSMGRKNMPIPSDMPKKRGEGESPAPTADRIEGRNPVLEAMRAGRTFNKIFVAQRQENARPDPTMARIINMAKDIHIPIVEVPKASLDDMSQTHNHQGVIAQVASHEYVEIDEILDRAAEKGEAPLLLILDELKDAYNLGSILRIADALDSSHKQKSKKVTVQLNPESLHISCESDADMSFEMWSFEHRSGLFEEVIGIKPGYNHFATMHILNSKKGTYFIADTLINEARDLKIIKSMVSRDGYKRYGLVYEKELFDETF